MLWGTCCLHENCKGVKPGLEDNEVELIPEWQPSEQNTELQAQGGFDISCLCGEVRLQTDSAPAKKLLCHCEDCRRWTGSVGQLAAWYERSQVKITGELVSFRKDGGSQRFRKNCARCNCCILTDHPDPEVSLMEVCIGSLGPMDLDAHLFFRQPIVKFSDSVKKFSDLPKVLGGSGALAPAEVQFTLVLPPTATNIQASCLCKSVLLDISGKPTMTALCHSADSRRWTGSIGHLAVTFPQEKVKITGELVTFREMRSDAKTQRVNCAQCFSCIMVKHEDRPETVEVCGGILPERFPLQAHFHYEQKVLSLKDGKPKLKDLPLDMGGTGEHLGQDNAAYVVVLVRDSDKDIGLSLQTKGDDFGRITKIKDGSMIEVWNRTCPQSKVVRIPDRLLSINSVAFSTEEAMIKLLKAPGKLALVFARHEPAE